MTEINQVFVMMMSGVMLIFAAISLILNILLIVAIWKCFTKMGYAGWKSIIPCYNIYIICKALYGNGWKFLLFLIPIYNIYFMFKLWIDYAHAFGESTAFGIALVLLPWIFLMILGFGDTTKGRMVK